MNALRRHWRVTTLMAVLLAAAAAENLLWSAAHHNPPTPRERLAADYEQLAAAEEALATQQQDANWATTLGLNPQARARLAVTCRRAVAAYNHDAPAAGEPRLDPAAHCR